MKYYNKNKIVSIDLIDEMENFTERDIKERKKYFKNSISYKYFNWIFHLSNDELTYKIPDGHYEKNGVIFMKPRIYITYVGYDHQTILFNSNKERDLYFKRNFQDLKLIK